MIKYFRRNQQVLIVSIVLYCVLIIFGNQILFFKNLNTEEFFKGSIFFYFFDISLLSKIPAFVFTIISFISLLFIGFYLVRLSINYLIIQTRTQFPALFVIAISSFAFQEGVFSMAIIGAIFLLIAFYRLVGSMEKQNINYQYIDGGILLALGSMFYTNLLFFLPFLWIAQIIIRKINTRETLFAIIGLLIPYLYMLTGAYLFNYPILDILKQIYYKISVYNYYNDSLQFLIGIGIYLFFLIIASIFAIMKFSSKKIQSRKLYQLLFYLFLNCLAIYFAVPSSGHEIFILISIPSSLLFSIYFTECRENFINSAFLILLIMVPLALSASRLIFS
jgi:hypothetical protein